jgi:cytochrome c553
MRICPNSSFFIKLLFTAILLGCYWLSFAQTSETAVLSGSELVKACTLCHGPQGRSTPYGYFPRLAGKPETYLFNQLLNFQQGKRHYAQMSYLLENVNPEYLHKLAHFFATQTIAYPPPAKFSDSKIQVELGRQLVFEGDLERKIPACSQCHGEGLTGGISESIPGLLGLPRDYLIAQLGAWRSNQRHAQEPDCMASIAKKLSINDVSAVTAWLSSQPWPKGEHLNSSKTSLKSKSLPERCGSVLANYIDANDQRDQNTLSLTPLQSKGQYLARIGNCFACHSTQGGIPMSGGKAIETPFGVVYSSNITPDDETGIGTWTSNDFWNAIHEGRSKDGRLLSPAFPYTELTQITRADSDAIFAYINTLPAISMNIPLSTITWPFNTQTGLRVWQKLYFKSGEYQENSKQSKSWNRGAYLVNGLLHCGSCHTPRNKLGASQLESRFAGAYLKTNTRWFAPSLLSDSQAGLQNWSTQQISNLLHSGITQKGYVSGPIAEVVYKGTQYLTLDDAESIATYLQSLKGDEVVNLATINASEIASRTQRRGKAIYDKYCETCHGAKGQGAPNSSPSLVGNRNVVSSYINNLVQSVLLGGIPPTTAANPSPQGMPPFRAVLSDRDVADVLTYIRGEWGNQASVISPLDILQITGNGH